MDIHIECIAIWIIWRSIRIAVDMRSDFFPDLQPGYMDNMVIHSDSRGYAVTICALPIAVLEASTETALKINVRPSQLHSI
jgi:hypothetical protein